MGMLISMSIYVCICIVVCIYVLICMCIKRNVIVCPYVYGYNVFVNTIRQSTAL